MKSETFWYGLLMVVLFGVVLAVADMDWPGDQGALMRALGLL